MKRKLTLGVFGFVLSALALLSSAQRAESQQACTLFCIQGYHCCVNHGGVQSCVPLSEPCKG